MFCFNEFAFTVQVEHKINSTQILGLILICLYFTTGHFHTCVLCKECSRYLPFLILGSVFSDCVVFNGGCISVACIRCSGVRRFQAEARSPTPVGRTVSAPRLRSLPEIAATLRAIRRRVKHQPSTCPDKPSLNLWCLHDTTRCTRCT